MFPLAHLLFARQVLGSLTQEEMLGAVAPDVIIATGFSWDVTHRVSPRLYERAVAARDAGHPDGEVVMRFARAALTHGAEPEGLDYYGDIAYGGQERGFSYLLARPLAERVAVACGVPADLGWWKAHNFVEMAIDLVIDQTYPKLGPSLVQALRPGRRGVSIAMFLDEALQLPAGASSSCFARFPSFLALQRLTPRNLAEAYEVQVRAKHGVAEIDVAAAAEIIAEAVALVRPEMNDFFTTAGEGVGRMLARFPG